MTPSAQLAQFLARYDPAIVKQAKAALKKMRARFQGADELVYDNYNALVSAFTPTGKTSDFICSLAFYPRWVTLFFAAGAKLPDPTRRLEGSGAIIRGIRLDGPQTLDEPEVRALLDAAIARGPAPLDPRRKGKLVIQSISKKQRPRRP